MRSGFLATPAVGDVSGDRRPDVVAAGGDGRIYAWDRPGPAAARLPLPIGLRAPAEKGQPRRARSTRRPRWPTWTATVGSTSSSARRTSGCTRYAATAGRWPAGPCSRATASDRAKILSSPAIGDLDGDGSPDVVEGTAEAYGSTPSTTGRVYAWSRDGRRLPGWPVRPEAVAADAIPLAGEGVPDSPVLADVDGDGRDEVAVAAFTGQPELYRGDGTRMGGAGATGAHFAGTGRGAASPADAPAVLALGGNAAFARLSPAGRCASSRASSTPAWPRRSSRPPRAWSSSTCSAAGTPPAEDGWTPSRGRWRAGRSSPPRPWPTSTATSAARCSPVGAATSFTPSARTAPSPRVGRSRRAVGCSPPPAVGDVDGDRLSEVVAVTRDGWMLVWDTPAPAGGDEWPAFRHDARNTGRHG